MSKNVAMFVDVANLYYSARGQDVDVDYVALLKHATKGRDLIRAYAYSGLDPENENQRKFIDFLGKNGYKVLTKDIRKFGDGRVKANLDIELVVDLFRLADRMDIAVVVSGDGDFAPAIRALQDKGVRCEVISFRPNTSSDLIAVADDFLDIMKIAGIGRGNGAKEAKAEKGMSMPEMPAKEVVPEFGFRDASPSVAAAALSALREGKDARPSAGGRGRGRGRTRAADKPEAATADTADAPVAAEEGASRTDANGEAATAEGRRRRRRRGGRGRGRSRSRGAEETAEGGAPEPDREIGWVEVDDLAQLEDVEDLGTLDEDREYTFEEADAATLAELGLEPGAAAGGRPEASEGGAARSAVDDDAAEAAEKPKRARRTRRTATSASAAEPAADEGEAKPARRRAASTSKAGSRSKATKGVKAAEKDEGKPAPRRRGRAAAAAGAGEEEPSPALRRGRSGAGRSASAAKSTESTKGTKDQPEGQDAAVPAGDEDSQGIWQRFRSAREGPKRGS